MVYNFVDTLGKVSSRSRSRGERYSLPPVAAFPLTRTNVEVSPAVESNVKVGTGPPVVISTSDIRRKKSRRAMDSW